MRACLLILLISPLAFAAPIPKDRKKSQEGIVGSWTVVKLDRPGLQGRVMLARNLRWIFKEDGSMAIQQGEPNSGVVTPDYSYKVDPNRSPGHFEFQYNANGGVGQPNLGLYQIDGDTLKIAYSLGGNERPQDFDSLQNGIIYTFTRTTEK
jgi:uncharacterized protein (TIGR03067 family)